MTVAQGLYIRVNGEDRRVAVGLTVAELLRELRIDSGRVAVERNLEVLPRSTYASVAVEEGDQYEIIRFVGGG